MGTLTFVAVVGLAAYRVARFVTKDTLVQRQREWLLGTRFGRSKAGELLVCPFCLGVWAGVGLALFWLHGGRIGHLVVATVAAIGLQALLSGADERLT